ncbi:MAG: hypothetical protein ACO3C1_06410 [Ilumatobacteraceae bacterium]
MARRLIPRLCAAVFVAGIAGLIVASINGNNAGVVLTIGLAIAFAAIALLSHAATRGREPIDVFEDAAMEQIEQRIQALVEQGAPEQPLRDLVRDALRVGRQ